MRRTTAFKSMVVLLLGTAGSACVAGCQGMESVMAARMAGEGDGRTYPVTPDEAWKISKHVLRWEGAEAIEENREEGYLTCTFGMNLVSSGSLAGVWIEKAAEDASKVTVICRRRVVTNVATVMTEGTFHRWFAKGVELLRAGRPLPKTHPRDLDVKP